MGDDPRHLWVAMAERLQPQDLTWGVCQKFDLHLSAPRAAEAEEAEVLLAILPGEDGAVPSFTADALKSLTATHFAGEANELSSDHLEWDAIHACAAESSKPPTLSLPELRRPAPLQRSPSKSPAHTILAQRRSAVAMDAKTRMSRAAFFELLARCMPSAGSVPFEAFPWSARVCSTHSLIASNPRPLKAPPRACR